MYLLIKKFEKSKNDLGLETRHLRRPIPKLERLDKAFPCPVYGLDNRVDS